MFFSHCKANMNHIVEENNSNLSTFNDSRYYLPHTNYCIFIDFALLNSPPLKNKQQCKVFQNTINFKISNN